MSGDVRCDINDGGKYGMYAPCIILQYVHKPTKCTKIL